MKPERKKIIKKRTTNATLVQIEKWLREESAQGWRLVHVKDGLFQNTYHFIQCAPSDEIYFAPSDFVKQPKYSSTCLSVLAYLKVAYGAKNVSKKDFCLWIRLSKSKITNVRDVKQNLLCRERCIKKDYLQWTISLGVCSLALFLISLFEGCNPVIALYATVPFIFFVRSLIQLIRHQILCKRIYKSFLED